MKKIILVRCGEIVLKGLNRHTFEEILIKNIKKAIGKFGDAEVIHSQSRIFIEPAAEDYDFDSAMERLLKVFGIVSISPAWKVESTMEAIKEYAIKATEHILSKISGNSDAYPRQVSFKVEAKRGNKRFPLKSLEICSELGGVILDKHPELKVDVHNPGFTIYIEVRENTYIYSEILQSFGGLPVGVSGKAMLLLSGGIDSPVAGWMLAKRGVEIECVHFHSYPYTSDRAKQKVVSLAKILSEYCGQIRLHIIPFTDIQLEINDKCPPDYGTLLMRRAMMRIAEKVAEQSGAQALITGESMGQVASQTMQSLFVTNAVVNMPVFRPLIGLDKNEVIEIARKINTFETSILPYEDCCTVFVAKHPRTRPRLEDVERIEASCELEDLIERAIENKEIILT